MNDNQKAASILRQYAGELYQGHTIGGEWDGEHIKAEHDELMALADRLALAQSGEGRMREALTDLIGAVRHLKPCPATLEKAEALAANQEQT